MSVRAKVRVIVRRLLEEDIIDRDSDTFQVASGKLYEFIGSPNSYRDASGFVAATDVYCETGT